MLLIGGMGLGLFFILRAFERNIIFFVTPSECAAYRTSPKVVRIGGLVKPGSVKHDATSLGMTFDVIDQQAQVSVSYKGVPPGLFKEGKGAVVRGRFSSQGVFIADQILAKHDEQYAPPPAFDPQSEAVH